ncbi:hypothetical protein [Streptomyces sp. 4F14]|uniref:hypothetical protein n=1 Tax=Streptomyces sp. 4F14 TaxID=3394380 RepID=UPI003A84528F
MPARRFLCACALALAVCSTAYVSPAHAVAVAASECAPEDEACKDSEAAAQKVEDQQKKTEEGAANAQKQIDAVGKQIQECEPGSSECMEKLSGSGAAEKQGIADMKDTISGFRTEPADNASSTSTTVCSGFAATLPAGESPFPNDQLCSLLGS